MSELPLQWIYQYCGGGVGVACGGVRTHFYATPVHWSVARGKNSASAADIFGAVCEMTWDVPRRVRGGQPVSGTGCEAAHRGPVPQPHRVPRRQPRRSQAIAPNALRKQFSHGPRRFRISPLALLSRRRRTSQSNAGGAR